MAEVKANAFHLVNLSVNFAGLSAKDPECNPGGSYVCTAGCTMPSCPPGSCAGTSVKNIAINPLDARILVAEDQLVKLRSALEKTILEFVKK